MLCFCGVVCGDIKEFPCLPGACLGTIHNLSPSHSRGFEQWYSRRTWKRGYKGIDQGSNGFPPFFHSLTEAPREYKDQHNAD